MNRKGIFITLEGGDGSGKTTMIQRLVPSLWRKKAIQLSRRENQVGSKFRKRSALSFWTLPIQVWMPGQKRFYMRQPGVSIWWRR